MLACKNSNKILAAYICVSSGRQTLVLVVETFLTFIIEDLCMIDITWQMCPSSCSINILSWFLTCFGPRSIFSKNIRWTTLLCWHLMNNRPKLYCTRLHFSGTIYQGFMELCGPRWESLLYYAEKWSMYRSTFARVSQSSVRRPLLFYGRFLFWFTRMLMFLTSRKAPAVFCHYINVPPALVSFCRGFNILAETLLFTCGHRFKVWLWW